VRNFFRKIFRNLIGIIDNELGCLLPRSTIQNIQNLYQIDHSQINVSFDQGSINATMGINEFDEEDDMEDE
jgi:hypothetical protein